MSETKAITKTDEKTYLPEHWGDRNALIEAANRIKTMTPGGEKLTTNQALAVAQAAVFSDANFMRGDIYGYQGRNGELITVDGYKLLVREAKRVCDYRTFKYDLTDEEAAANGLNPNEDIACWVYVLRDDRKEDYRFELNEAKEFGMGYHEARRAALEYTASKAIGYVRKSDMWSQKYNKPVDPPKNMTWPEKAEQRGLKQALRKAYALPSPKELAQRAMQVDGTMTAPEDWQDVGIYKTGEERAAAAKVSAWDRETGERFDDLPLEEKRQKFAANVQAMRGPDDEPGIGDEPEDGEFTEATESEFPHDDPDFPVDPETGEWNEELASAGDDVEQPETIVYDGPTSPREFTALVNEERQRQGMKPFEELKDLSAFLKTRDLADGGAWPKTPEGWGKAWQAATVKA